MSPLYEARCTLFVAHIKEGVKSLFTVLTSVRLMVQKDRIRYGILTLLRILAHGLDLLALLGVATLTSRLAGDAGRAAEFPLFFSSFFSADPGRDDFILMAVVILLLFLGKSLVGVVLLWGMNRFLAGVEARSAEKVGSFLFFGDLTRLRSFSRGEIQWSVSTSSQVAFSTVLLAGSTLLTEVALLIFVLFGFFIVEPSLSLGITLYFALVVLGYQLLIGASLQRLGRRLATFSVALNNRVLDMVGVFREGLLSGSLPALFDDFVAVRTSWSHDQARSRLINGLPRYFVEGALILGVGGLILWQASTENLADVLVSASVLLAGGTRMMAALVPIQSSISVLRIEGPKAQRAQSLIQELQKEQQLRPIRVNDERPKVERPSTPPKIQLRKVQFNYPRASERAIESISLDISAGSFCAIAGPSGSGKSTLANLILGLLNPSSGEVLIDEIPPRKIWQILPGVIAYVPQTPGMVSGTIAENVAIGIPREDIDVDRVKEALRRANLLNEVENLLGGIFGLVGAHKDGMSGGQIQRLGIARALYTRPSLLVLDEVTSALDPITERTMSDLIISLRGKVTVVAIAHRLTTVRAADQVVFINRGRAVAHGSFQEVSQRVPLFRDYIGHSQL